MSQLEAQTILDPLPLPTAAAAGNSMLPEYYSPEMSSTPGVEEAAEPIEHQWRGFQSDSEPDIKLTFRSGQVEWNTTVTAPEVTFTAPTEAEKVWCKITVDAMTEEATEAVIEHGETLPTDTVTLKHWLIAEIVEMYPDGSWYPAIRQIQFEPIRKIVPSTVILHEWRVYRTDADPELLTPTYGVAGGTVHGDGGPLVASSVTGIGDVAFIWVKITTELASVTEVQTITAAIIESGGVIPVDTEPGVGSPGYIHRAIAEVDADNILQIAFEPIYIKSFADAMPDGVTGDTLYHDGNKWVVLGAPSGSITNPVLSHTGTATVWVEDQMGSGTTPTGTYDGEILFWDVATSAWKVSTAPDLSSIPYWDDATKAYKWVPSPYSGGRVLTTDGTDHTWEEPAGGGGGTDTVAVVEDLGSGAQVNVSSAVVGATTTYTVRGNSVDQVLSYKVGDATAVPFATFKDGLLTADTAYVDILIPEGGDTSSNHPFKITAGAVAGSFNIAAGIVFHESGSIAVAGMVGAAAGNWSVKILRDSASRAVTAAVLENTVGNNTSYEQYVPIGNIDGFGVIRQDYFTNINVSELLTVRNGAFTLVSLAMIGFNTYAPP